MTFASWLYGITFPTAVYGTYQAFQQSNDYAAEVKQEVTTAVTNWLPVIVGGVVAYYVLKKR